MGGSIDVLQEVLSIKYRLSRGVRSGSFPPTMAGPSRRGDGRSTRRSGPASSIPPEVGRAHPGAARAPGPGGPEVPGKHRTGRKERLPRGARTPRQHPEGRALRTLPLQPEGSERGGKGRRRNPASSDPARGQIGKVHADPPFGDHPALGRIQEEETHFRKGAASRASSSAIRFPRGEGDGSSAAACLK